MQLRIRSVLIRQLFRISKKSTYAHPCDAIRHKKNISVSSKLCNDKSATRKLLARFILTWQVKSVLFCTAISDHFVFNKTFLWRSVKLNFFMSKSEIGIINYFCSSLTHNSQIRLWLVIPPKWITDFNNIYNSIKMNYWFHESL